MLLVLGASVAGFVQGLSGFAFGMVAMSFWVWGVEPGLAAVMSVFGGLTGQLFSAATVRRGLHLHLLLPFLAGGALGVPIGVLALPHLEPSHFKLVLGTVLLVCCPAMLFAPRMPPLKRGGRLGDAAAGAVGGLMGGIGGFTGVVPALWCTLRGYNKDAHRAVLQNFNLAVLSATLATLVWSGRLHAGLFPQMGVVAGALIIPSIYGSKIYIGMSPKAFRDGVLWLLVFAGLVMLAASLRSMLA